MAGLKDILKLSSLIAGVIPGGQLVAPIIGGVAAVIPGGDDDDDDKEEQAWKVSMTAAWKAKIVELMDKDMLPDVKRRVSMDLIRADFFDHYAEMPKERYVDKLHADLVFVVKARIAAGS